MGCSYEEWKIIRVLLDCRFAFLLDVSVHYAIMFILFSIYSIQANQRGVDHANSGNGALGLVNATIGILEDIVWECGAESSDLPFAVLVSCEVWRTGPREGFLEGIPIVPTTPLKTSFESRSQQMAQTRLPLRSAWAVTVHWHKSLRLGLGRKEFSCGLTFVALSRVTSLSGPPFH
jgi:hypothetical protein